MSWVKFMLEKEKKAECWQHLCGSDELHWGWGGWGGWRRGDCLLLREEDWKDLWSELAGRRQETIPICPGWNVGSLLTQVTERETLICSSVKWEDRANPSVCLPLPSPRQDRRDRHTTLSCFLVLCLSSMWYLKRGEFQSLRFFQCIYYLLSLLIC